MQENIKTNIVTAFKGFAGTTSASGGIYVSLLPSVEAWLRIIALLLGIAVSIVTIWSIIRNWREP